MTTETIPLTVKGVAALLDGNEYPLRIPHQRSAAWSGVGIVVVYGASDDLMEFSGAIDDEIGAPDDPGVLVSPRGLLPDFEELCDLRDEVGLRQYFIDKDQAVPIKAIWDRDGISWQYETTIPHETFDIMEDGDVYCRGIVFNLKDVAQRGEGG